MLRASAGFSSYRTTDCQAGGQGEGRGVVAVQERGAGGWQQAAAEWVCWQGVQHPDWGREH